MTPDRSLHLPHAALTLIHLSEVCALAVFDVCFCSSPAVTITSVFPMLPFSPLLSIPICQSSHLLCISSSVSVTTARSSANSSSRGNPRLNSSLVTPSTTINRNGLSPDPWCSPTLMGNSSVYVHVHICYIEYIYHHYCCHIKM